ncbi:MAG: cytochrome c [Saprospiraceae bacterium]|nr:cytochrome c [Candidatus Opimibacter skivensis]MBP6680002.1 cytochrome c [Saprospiraceae bacterium]MBP8086460.1 cytochrome c [Saprospiraceae bacterium]
MAPDFQKTIVGLLLTLSFLTYSFYLYSSLPVRDAVFTIDVDRGKAIWQQHNCTACHQVYGLGGYLGPDLTNEYSKRGPDIIKAMIRTGTKTMPAFNLTEEETSSLLSYLKHIDQTGIADPRSFKIKLDGTIDQE